MVVWVSVVLQAQWSDGVAWLAACCPDYLPEDLKGKHIRETYEVLLVSRVRDCYAMGRARACVRSVDEQRARSTRKTSTL